MTFGGKVMILEDLVKSSV